MPRGRWHFDWLPAGTVETLGRLVKDVLGRLDQVLNAERWNCLVSHSADQNLATATPTVLTWDTEAWNVAAVHSTTTNPTRLTIPSGAVVGPWLIQAQVSWDIGTTGYRRIQIRKNGATVLGSSSATPNPTVATDQQVSASDHTPTVGDYYELVATHTQGAGLVVLHGRGATWFAIFHGW